MKNITSPGLIKLKGILFLLVGLFASVLLFLEHPTVKAAVLLAIAVWCFCRFYYFAFYVIEHYVDSSYRLSGLWSLFRYLMQQRNGKRRGVESNLAQSPRGDETNKHDAPQS